MTRALTEQEEDEILIYMKSHPEEDVYYAVIPFFEEKFKMPITAHCIQKIIVKDLLKI
jgi:hypothetical protein